MIKVCLDAAGSKQVKSAFKATLVPTIYLGTVPDPAAREDAMKGSMESVKLTLTIGVVPLPRFQGWGCV